jgi:hypothetical protein
MLISTILKAVSCGKRNALPSKEADRNDFSGARSFLDVSSFLIARFVGTQLSVKYFGLTEPAPPHLHILLGLDVV